MIVKNELEARVFSSSVEGDVVLKRNYPGIDVVIHQGESRIAVNASSVPKFIEELQAITNWHPKA